MNQKAWIRFIALWAVAALLSVPMGLASGFPFVAYTKEMTALRLEANSKGRQLAQVPAQSAVHIEGELGDYYIGVYEGTTGYIAKAALSQDLKNEPGVQATPRPADPKAAADYPTLSKGDEGEAVKALQTGLMELKFLKGKADGKFGTGTQAAVEAFQKKNKLPANGIADSVTQKTLFEGAPLNVRGKKQAVKTLSVTKPVDKLKQGDAGQQVEALQNRLKELGYLSGKADGVYGKSTKAAVKLFQKTHKIGQDGIAGQKTLALLNSAGALPKGATPTPKVIQPTDVPKARQNGGITVPADPGNTEPPATYPYQTTALAAVNMRSRARTSSMRILTIPAGAALTVNKAEGDFLNVSYKNRTGYVLAQYIFVPEQYLPGRSFPQDTMARVKYQTLTQGASGDAVKALELALTELGYYTKMPQGAFTQELHQAVAAFQSKNGYKATGIALPEMQKLLYEGRPRNVKNKKVAVLTLPPVENPEIRLGNQGEQVTMLQRTLLTLGFYQGTVDGVYGASTQKAVRAYQKAHSIRETGKMDSFTWMSIRAAVSTPAPYQTPSPENEINENNVIVMTKGTRGLAVTKLEERLIALGYKTDVPNGVYDASDMDAVRAFQRNNGLTSSGVADLYTQRALYSANAVPAAEAPPKDWQSLNTPTPVPEQPLPQDTLLIGSFGEAVSALQSRLIALKYLSGKADGIYGTQTAKAVTAFQKASGLTPDGVAGAQTLKLLYQTDAKSNTPQGGLPDMLTRTLSVGMRGEDVMKVQRRLIVLGYMTGAGDAVFGPKTATAVQAFQQRNSLKADGMVGALTYAKLFAQNAVPQGGITLPGLDGLTGQTGQNGQTEQPKSTPPVSFAPPRASEVRFAMWASEVRARTRSMPNVKIYDFISGKSYNVHIFSNGAHADGEPVTAEDTAIMESALGKANWTPRPVWVIFSDGRVYMASTHSRGHEVDHRPNNNLTGHICIHFPRDMADAQKTGPYAVSHQNAILAGWDLTQNLGK